MTHIVIFRTSGSYIDYNTYNCQEIGLAKALAKKGYRVSVIMAGPEASRIGLKCAGGEIAVFYLKYKALNQSICIFDGWKGLLERLCPDVLQVHEFGMLMSWQVARWAKRKGIRCVLIQGNYATTRKPILKQLECAFNLTLGSSVIGMAAAIGSKTKAAAEYIRRYGNVSCNLTPVGLDEDKFSTIVAKCDVKVKYGVSGKKTLLYVGALEPRRNPLFLLEVLRNLPGDYTLLVVGDGPQRKEMECYVAAYGMGNVVMTGKLKQEELASIYQAADVFLLASDYEIFGMVILEAMYFGTPVISTATAGAGTVIDSMTGVILPALDVEQWKSSIMDVCENNERLFSMKERCCSVIREKYVWDKASDKFIELYG